MQLNYIVHETDNILQYIITYSQSCKAFPKIFKRWWQFKLWYAIIVIYLVIIPISKSVKLIYTMTEKAKSNIKYSVRYSV